MWWLIVLSVVVLLIFIGLIIISILISNRKLLRLQQERFEEIQRSERMYADLFDNVSDLVYIHQFDGKILKINQAARNLLGYSVSELIGQNFQKVFSIPNEKFYTYIHSLDNKDQSSGMLKLRARNGKELIFEYQNSVMRQEDNMKAIRGIARNVTERIEAEKELKKKDTLLTAVADASIILLLNPDHKSAINTALEILGKATNVDRVYIFENHYDKETNGLFMSQRFEWCKEGVEPQIDNPLLQNLPYNHPYAKPMFERVRVGEIYSGVVRLMSDAEKEIFEPQGIKSIIIIPIYIGRKFWGFIGFDDCTTERIWSEIEISILKAAAGSIGGLIGLMQAENELEKTNIFLSNILQSSITISIITFDLNGVVTYWNSGAENLYGFKASEIIGQNLLEKLTKESDNVTLNKINDMISLVKETKSTQVADVVFYHKNGKQLWVKLTISPLIDEKGETTGLLSIGEDITQRKITELALIQNEEMFRNVWENSVDGMRLIDEDARIKLVNQAFCKLVEMPYEKLEGQDYHICYLQQDPQGLQKFKKHLRDKNIPMRQSTEIQLWNEKKIPVEISNSFIELQDNKIMLLSIFRDISEQKEYERKIKLSEEKYRKLALHLQTIREEERAIISREIHDQLGQLLTALYFEFTYLPTIKNKKQFNERIDGINNLIDTLIATVQRISSELRPPILDDLGLIPAIEWEVSQFSKRTNIVTDLNVFVDEINFNKNTSTIIFRILQESLTNVARHSKATRVNINLEKTNGYFQMIVQDNGEGIPDEKLTDPHSIGLIGMKERAFSINGELKIESSEKKGTKVILQIPINEVKND